MLPVIKWKIAATDTFRRSDSATDINPSSDGGTWTMIRGGGGILGNHGYFPVMDSGLDDALAWRDVGGNIQDVTVTNYRSSTGGRSALNLNWNGIPGPAYILEFDSSASATIFGADSSEAVTLTPWTGGSTTLRMVTFHGDDFRAHVLIYQDGVQVHEFIETGYITSTGIAIDSQGHHFYRFTDEYANLIVKTGERVPWGVLKVKVGAGWRKVGCGGRGVVDAVTELIVCAAFDGTQYDPPNLRYLRRDGVELYNDIDGIFTGSDAPGGTFSLHITDPHSGGVFGWYLGDPDPPYGVASRGGGGASGGWSGPMTGTIISAQTWDAPDVILPTPGRLRMQLPDGSWVREACDHDTAPIPFRTGGWRYLQVSAGDSTDRSAVSFDDSAWSIGSGAFGSSTPSSSFFTTAWAQTTRLWLRRSIPEAAAYKVQVEVDDVAVIYWNGNLLATYTLSPPTHPDLSPVYDVPAAFIVPGAQTLAIRATDTSGTGSGTQAKVDAEVTRFARPLKIEDPVGSGTWITVACMVPASDFALYDSALYDTAAYG